MVSEPSYICPVCGSNMVLRRGPNTKFYGCESFPQSGCTGKRDLHGNAWGCYDETPFHLNDEGVSMFSILRKDGFSYEEASEIAADWQRQEERDPWK